MKMKLFVLLALPMVAMFFMGAAQVAGPGCSCDAHGKSTKLPVSSTELFNR